MRHILLPTDFSENSWGAISYAIELFNKDKVKFHILHAFSPYVVTPSGPIEAQVMDETIFRAAEQNCRRELEQLKERMLNNYPDLDIELYAKFDFFVTSIERFLEEHTINCIVLGTKGASGLKEIVMGSNTSSLIGKVRAPILAIPEDTTYKSIKKVVIGSDLSVVPTKKGIETIRRLLELTSAELHIVSIHKQERELSIQEKDIQDVYVELLKGHTVLFNTRYEKDIESGINEYVKEIDAEMLCVIAKKHTFLSRLLERSKSKSLTNHTKIPLLVLNERFF